MEPLMSPRSPLAPRGREMGRFSSYLLGTTVNLLPVMISTLPFTAWAADSDPQVNVKLVEVVGSRIVQSPASPSTPKHGTTQVSTVSGGALQSTGQANLISALEQSSPYVSASPYAGAGGNGFVVTMQLRNLSADQTLVLVNGLRRHLSSNFVINPGPNEGTNPADISLIPGKSIDHIEIIGDGASILYGQEAIAGAVNVVLKQQKAKSEVSINTGGFYPGDGMTTTGNAIVGVDLGKSGGYLNFATQVSRQQLAIRANPYIGSVTFGGNSDPMTAKIGRDINRQPALPSYTLGQFSLDAMVPVAPGIEAYSTATYAHRNGLSTLAVRTQTNDQVVRGIYPYGFQPYETSNEDDFQVNVGLRGKNIHRWDWNLYATYGLDSNDFYTTNSDSPSFGLKSKTNFYTGTLTTTAVTTGFSASRPLGNLAILHNARLAFGVEYRHDGFDADTGELQSWGDGGGLILDGPNKGKKAISGVSGHRGISPDEAGSFSRDIFGGHSEFNFNIMPQWQWTLGGRVYNYSDMETIETGGVSTRYTINSQWALRANFSTGYRPPTLEQMNYTSIIPAVGTSRAGVPPTSAAGLALGGKPLKGEYSRNYSIGVDAAPASNWHLTGNLYYIAINDRLYDTDQFGGTAAQNILTGIGIDGISFISYYTNPVNTVTYGGDLETDYTLNLPKDEGQLRFNFAFNYADTEISHFNQTPAIINQLGYTYFGDYAKNGLLHSNPKSKIILGVDWASGPFSVSVREIRYGSVIFMQYPTQSSANWTKVDAAFITNLRVGYKINPKTELYVGANNLFNHYPNKLSADSVQNASGAASYPTYSPYGFFGGFYYAGVNVTF